jgi:hypothetical protein
MDQWQGSGNFGAKCAEREAVCIVIGVRADGGLHVYASQQGKMDAIYARQAREFITRPNRGLLQLVDECVERAREIQALGLDVTT